MTAPLPGFHLLRSKHDELAKAIATLAFKNNKYKQLAEEEGTYFEDHPLVLALNKAEWDDLLIYAYDRYHQELDLRRLGDNIIFLMEVAELVSWATENFDESRIELIEAMKRESDRRIQEKEIKKMGLDAKREESSQFGKLLLFFWRMLPFVRV